MEGILDFLRGYKGIIKLFNMDVTYLASLIGIFVFTYLFKFYFHLIFGRTIGQGLMFLKSGGGVVWARIGGSLRELSGVVLTPMILFDLPLVNGRSLKEKITMSDIESVDSKKGILYTMPIVCIIFVFSFFGPLFYHMTLVDGLKVSFDKVKKIKLNNKSQFERYKFYRSNRFMFESFSDLSGGRFLLLPDFEVIKEVTRSRINPFIKVYDSKSKSIFKIYLAKPYSLLKILNKASTGNFLFASKYPLIAEAIENEPIYKRWPAIDGKKVKKLFKDKLIIEIQALIESSMELGFSNIFSHIMNNGPFIRGHVELRNTFLNIVEEGIAPEVDIIKFGNNSFLRFRHTFSDLIHMKGAYQETLIPIDTPYSQVLVFTCENCKDSSEGLEIFKKKFFGGARWMFDYQQYKLFPKSEGEVDTLSIVDYLNNPTMNSEQKRVYEEGVYNHFYDIAKSSLKNNDLILQKEIIKSLDKMSIVVGNVNIVKKDYYSKKIMNFLKVLNVSLIHQNTRYFAIESEEESDE